MRVAVHFPAGHELARGESSHPDVQPSEGPAVVAYKLGRIEEGVHNAPVGHPEVPLEEFLAGLVRQAQEEYPDADVRVERLVDKGDGSSEWIDADEFDPEVHTPVGAGHTVVRDVSADLSPGSEVER